MLRVLAADPRGRVRVAADPRTHGTWWCRVGDHPGVVNAPDMPHHLVIANDGGQSLVLQIEPIGMIYPVRPNDQISVHTDLATLDQFEVTVWDYGLSLWLFDAVLIVTSSGELLDHLGRCAAPFAIDDPTVVRFVVTNHCLCDVSLALPDGRIAALQPAGDYTTVVPRSTVTLRLTRTTTTLDVQNMPDQHWA
jgi:hypothetical protein